MLKLSPSTPAHIETYTGRLGDTGIAMLSALKRHKNKDFIKQYETHEDQHSKLYIAPFEPESVAMLCSETIYLADDESACLETAVEVENNLTEYAVMVAFRTDTVVFPIGTAIDRLADQNPTLPRDLFEHIYRLPFLGISDPLNIYQSGEDYFELLDDEDDLYGKSLLAEMHPHLRQFVGKSAETNLPALPDPYSQLLFRARILTNELWPLMQDETFSGLYQHTRYILTGDHDDEAATNSTQRRVADDEAEHIMNCGGSPDLRFLAITSTRKLTAFLRVWSQIQKIGDRLVKLLTQEEP